MWKRTAEIQNLDFNDYEKLSNFIHELRSHSMYKFIVDDLKQRVGFIRKEHILREDNQSQTFYSTIIFDTEENLKNYADEESIQSLWTYLELSSTQQGFTFKMYDEEI